MPPKSVFQMLLDPTLIEEFSRWKVAGDEIKEGASWVEKKWLMTRHWTITEFDRRALRYVASWNDIQLTMTVKKGGTWACNVRMVVSGPNSAVRKFEKSDGERLEQIAGLMKGS